MAANRSAPESDWGVSRRGLLRRIVPWGIGMTVAGGLATGSVYAVGGWLRGWGRVPPPRWEMPLRPPILGAHRGGRALFPENTLTAFVSSYEQFGCRFMELDVHVTRDGVPVVIHDDTVDRTTGGTGRVAEHTLAELQRLDAGARFRGLDGVSWAGRGVRIPTLYEVLSRLPDCVFSVELKPGPLSDAPAVVAAVRQAGMERRVLLGSADQDAFLRIQAAAPDIPSFYSFRSGFLLLLAMWLGLSGWYCPDHNALEIPQRLFGLDYLTPRIIRAAHDLGLPMLVWTVNDPAEMERLLRRGVDGIITDRPDLLARVLGR